MRVAPGRAIQIEPPLLLAWQPTYSPSERPVGVIASMQVCANAKCACTDLTLTGFEVDDRLMSAEKMAEGIRLEWAQQGAIHPNSDFSLSIDIQTGELKTQPTHGSPVSGNVSTKRHATAILQQVLSGEVLDAFHALWREKKGASRPSSWRDNPALQEWESGTLLSSMDALLEDRLDVYKVEEEFILVDDLHCVAPHCDCVTSVLSLYLLTKSSTGSELSDIGNISLDLNTGERGKRSVKSAFKAKFDQVLETLGQRYPRLLDRLRARRERVRAVGNQLLQEREKKRGLSAVHANQSRPEGVTMRVGKVGPNDLCPCGSGKKFKKCCRA